MLCRYCKKNIIGKAKKVGPKLRFCDDRCYAKDCLKSGGWFTDVIPRLYPKATEDYYRENGLYEQMELPV